MTVEQVSDLLEEYLAAREKRVLVDVGDLERRAGDRVEEFRRRLSLFEELEGLSDLLDGSEEIPADRERIGRFEVRHLIGEGGLSRVYLAQDPNLGREVAIKVLRREAVSLADARRWMTSEGQSLGKLDHENIVRVYELSEDHGVAFIAMEHVDGVTLHEALQALRALSSGGELDELPPRALAAAEQLRPIGARVHLVAQIARALQYCHELGVIHRDIKPGNVLLAPGPKPKLIDFGLAHLESIDSISKVTRQLVGTAAYLAPEQVDQKRTGSSKFSDQFALGTLLYELLTLQHPFDAESYESMMARISRAEPVPPRRRDASISNEVERICLHALERAPKDRYASVGHLASDLEAFLEHRAISIQPPGPWRRLRLWARRNRQRAALVATVAAAGAVALVLWFALALVEVYELRGRGEREVAALAPASGPEAFRSAFRVVNKALVDAAEHQASLVSSFLPDALPSVEQRHRAASETLAAALRRAYGEPRQILGAADRLALAQAAESVWRDVLYDQGAQVPADQRLSSSFGRVRVPPGGELFQVGVTADGLLELRPLDADVAVGNGLFRYRFRRDGALGEYEFQALRQEPPWALELPAVLPRRDGMISVQPLRGEDVGPQPPRGFLLSERPVSWADLGAVLEPDAWQEWRGVAAAARRGDAVGDDEPAHVPWATAREYARLRACRLPSPSELRCAWQQGLLGSEPKGAEWTSSITPDGSELALALDPQLESSQQPATWFAPPGTQAGINARAFRVAVTQVE